MKEEMNIIFIDSTLTSVFLSLVGHYLSAFFPHIGRSTTCETPSSLFSSPLLQFHHYRGANFHDSTSTSAITPLPGHYPFRTFPLPTIPFVKDMIFRAKPNRNFKLVRHFRCFLSFV